MGTFVASLKTLFLLAFLLKASTVLSAGMPLSNPLDKLPPDGWWSQQTELVQRLRIKLHKMDSVQFLTLIFISDLPVRVSNPIEWHSVRLFIEHLKKQEPDWKQINEALGMAGSKMPLSNIDELTTRLDRLLPSQQSVFFSLMNFSHPGCETSLTPRSFNAVVQGAHADLYLSHMIQEQRLEYLTGNLLQDPVLLMGHR